MGLGHMSGHYTPCIIRYILNTDVSCDVTSCTLVEVLLFWRHLLPLSSGQNRYPEDRYIRLLRNVDTCVLNCVMSHKKYSSIQGFPWSYAPKGTSQCSQKPEIKPIQGSTPYLHTILFKHLV